MTGRSKRTRNFNRKVAPPKKKDRVEVESDSLAATTNHNPVTTTNSALSPVRCTRRNEVKDPEPHNEIKKHTWSAHTST